MTRMVCSTATAEPGSRAPRTGPPADLAYHRGTMTGVGGMRATIDELAARFLSDAAAVDAADELPGEHLRGLAAAGLYGIFAPEAEGGLGLSRRETWPVVEELASACLATAFVWIQHFGLLEALLDPAAPAGLRAGLLPGAIRGEVRGGLALAGLLPGPPRLTATPVAGGWRLDGQAPWVTGWGVVNLLLVAARGPQDSVVRLLVDATGGRGSPPSGSGSPPRTPAPQSGSPSTAWWSRMAGAWQAALRPGPPAVGGVAVQRIPRPGRRPPVLRAHRSVCPG